MSYTNIMVHLSADERAMHRLQFAANYALAQDARLIAVFTDAVPNPDWFYMMDGAARILEEDQERRHHLRDAIHARFREAVKALPLETEWRAMEGDPLALVLREAREADLLVIGQRDPDAPQSPVEAQFVETLVLQAGCPVLVLPYTGNFDAAPRRILLAWNGGRESARALHDAIPLMKDAAVHVLQIEGPRPQPWTDGTTVGQAARALKAHGISATVKEASCDDSDILAGEMLLSRAADFNADLLVMGAYGHSRLREWALGGVTRTLLGSMTLPVLMSH